MKTRRSSPTPSTSTSTGGRLLSATAQKSDWQNVVSLVNRSLLLLLLVVWNANIAISHCYTCAFIMIIPFFRYFP